MIEERAIEAMRVFVKLGYTVQLYARPADDYNPTDVYGVALVDLRFDAIDLRAVCDAAEAIGMTVTMHGIENGKLRVHEPDPRPAVVRNPRRHPR